MPPFPNTNTPSNNKSSNSKSHNNLVGSFTHCRNKYRSQGLTPKKKHSFLLLLFGRFLCLLLLTRTTLLFPNHSPRKIPLHIHSGLGHNIQLHLHRHLTLSYIFHAFSNTFLQYSIPFKHTPAKVRTFQLVPKKRNLLRHTQKLLAGGPLHINESTYRLDSS